jgi:hypothetical protein
MKACSRLRPRGTDLHGLAHFLLLDQLLFSPDFQDEIEGRLT